MNDKMTIEQITEQRLEALARNNQHFDALKMDLLGKAQLEVLLNQIAEHPECPSIRVLLSLDEGTVDGLGTTFPAEVAVVDYYTDYPDEKPEDFDLPYYDEDGNWIGIIREYGMHPDHNDEDARKYWDIIDGK